MKMFKLDNNYMDCSLPDSMASKFGITNIYHNNIERKQKMFAIINMVSKTVKKCDILSWSYDGIGINGQYYNYTNYVIMENYLFEVKNYMEVKLARRYFKILKIKDKLK